MVKLGRKSRLEMIVICDKGVHMDEVIRKVNEGMGKIYFEGGTECDCLASCIQITWYYVANRERV